MKPNSNGKGAEKSVRPGIDHRIVGAVVAVSVVMLAASGVMGHLAVTETRRTVSDQFNAEQLVIARNVGRLVEREFNDLRKEIAQLARQLGARNTALELSDGTIRMCLSRVMESGVWKIEWMDAPAGISRMYLPYSMQREDRKILPDADFEQEIALHAGNGPWFDGPDIQRGEVYLNLSSTIATQPPGRVRFHVKINWLLSPMLRDIRSGQTGYVWIIDRDGYFMFHPDINFIGENAFFIRQAKYPDISFVKINFIQKERMLQGEEGTGAYTAGWHRGVTGEIDKLIAYCPLTVSETPSIRWSVAVVAPVTEIEAAVRKGYGRHLLLQAMMILTIVAGAVSIIYLERRWSQRLEAMVADRTEAYKRSEEKYRSLVESAEDFIFTVNADGMLLSMNSFTAKFFGGTPQDFIGRHLSQVVDEAVARKQMQSIRSVFGYGKSVRDEFELKNGDRATWLSANYMPLKKNGDINAVLCIARDVTDNKKLERQLINTEKLASLGTLAAGVAHEVNNPLGVILGFCDLLLQKAEKESQLYTDLKTIERQGLHCKQVVENLLSFSRVKNGVAETCDVNRCLADIIGVVRHTLEMNRIELSVETDERIPMVSGDPWQLQQVFLNLINNAGAAMADGGGFLKIRTRFDKKSRKAVIEFADTGVGIPPENLDRIYEPFFTTKPEGEGTGLGLFVSYGIVAKYGGSIECTRSRSGGRDPNRRGDRGTTFVVTLPMGEKSC